MNELDRGQRAMFMDRIGHHREGGNVIIRPQPTLVGRLTITRGVNLHLLGRNNSPAALGLYPT